MMKYFLVTLIVFIVFTNAQKVKKGYPNLKATSEINHMVSEVEEQVRAVLDYPDDGEKFKALFYRFKFDIIPFLDKIRKPTKGTTYFVKVDTGYSKDQFIVLRIFRDLEEKTISLTGIKEKQTRNGVIDFFDGNLNSFNHK